METMDLQKLIDNKAETRLNKDLIELCQLIRENRLFCITSSDTIPDLTFNGKEEKPYWIFKPEGKYMDKVKEYWLPIYKNEEAQNFIKKVEDLSNDVNDLMSNGNYD